MPTVITRDQVRTLVARDGAQLVEVLPRREFDDEHLPDAIHLPLKRLDARTAEILDRTRPVVVYCWDALWDMSPRAAWRLERLGHRTVYDYAAGKVDWIAAGWPTVRADTSERRALDGVERGAPTCGPDARVRDLVATDGRGIVVVNDHRIVLGRVRPAPPTADVRAEAIMEAGPTTVRAHEPLEPLLARMRDRAVDEMIVTTPEGALIGVVYRDARA